jgi:hypothetical protein
MPSDLTIRAVSSAAGPNENVVQPKPESVIPPANASPPQTGPPIFNPTLHFDAALGLVVIEFRDASGQVTTTIPTQRQMDAYRMWSAPLPGGGTPPAKAQASTQRKA